VGKRGDTGKNCLEMREKGRGKNCHAKDGDGRSIAEKQRKRVEKPIIALIWERSPV